MFRTSESYLKRRPAYGVGEHRGLSAWRSRAIEIQMATVHSNWDVSGSHGRPLSRWTSSALWSALASAVGLSHASRTTFAGGRRVGRREPYWNVEAG